MFRNATKNIGKRVRLKDNPFKNVKGTISHWSVEYMNPYRVDWDEPLIGDDCDLHCAGWYNIDELLIIDREEKLERILKKDVFIA